MKIAVIHASAGHGHQKAAESIVDSLLFDHPSVDVQLLDALSYCPRFFANSYRKTYEIAVRYFPGIWAFFYWALNIRILQPIIQFLRRAFNFVFTSGLRKHLRKESFDVIVSTHFLPAQVAGRLRNQGKIKAKTFTVITDFRVHKFWVNPGTFRYIVATESSAVDLARVSVSNEIILNLGIPIELKFSKTYDPLAVRKELGFEADELIVLVTTGSFGLGAIESYIEEICRLPFKTHAVIVCGHNASLMHDLRAKQFTQRTSVLGYITYMEKLMAASDYAIIKPGGLTVSEGLAMRIPLLITMAIPGQEEGNKRYLLSNDAAIDICEKRLSDVINDFQKNPKLKNKLMQRMAEIAKPDAVKDIIKVIMR